MYQSLSALDLGLDIIIAVINITLFITLVGDCFIFSKKRVMLIVGCMYIAALIIKYGTDISIGMYMATIVIFSLVHFLFIRQDRLNNYTIFQMGVTMYSIISTIITGGVYMIYSLTGKGSGWYVKDENGPAMYVVMYVSIILAAILSVVILRKIKPTLISLGRGAEITTFLLIVVESVVATMLKGIGNAGEYSNSASGVFAYIDFITILCCLGVFAFLIIRMLKEVRLGNREHVEELKKEESAYRELQQKQEELENIRHDMRNRRNDQ